MSPLFSINDSDNFAPSTRTVRTMLSCSHGASWLDQELLAAAACAARESVLSSPHGGSADSSLEAPQLSKATDSGKPLKVLWTSNEDTKLLIANTVHRPADAYDTHVISSDDDDRDAPLAQSASYKALHLESQHSVTHALATCYSPVVGSAALLEDSFSFSSASEHPASPRDGSAAAVAGTNCQRADLHVSF